MKQLTDEQIFELAEPFGAFEYGDAQGHKRLEFVRAVIDAFCRINGLTGEAQPEDGRCDHHACIYPMCDCEAQPAADDKDGNAPWLTEAHMLCTDAGIPHGNITERIKALRERLADDKAGGELWRPVVGYEGMYEVSSHGQLKNVVTGSIRSTKSLAGAGYVKADLWKDGLRKQTTMHRLVAEAFIGPLSDMEVNHKNGIKIDNRAENLEIVTKSQNEQHSRYALGNLCKPVVGISDSLRQFYPSIEEAARKTSASAAGIYRCLNGQATYSGGMKWEYSTEADTRPQPQAEAPDTGLLDAAKAMVRATDYRAAVLVAFADSKKREFADDQFWHAYDELRAAIAKESGK